MKLDLRVYAVTDRTWTGEKSLFCQLEEALQAGVTLVQLREKKLDDDAFLEEARQIKALTDSYGVPLIINDNVRRTWMQPVYAAFWALTKSWVSLQRQWSRQGGQRRPGQIILDPAQFLAPPQRGRPFL